ncbi:hypothetical protein HER39_04340, partial [Arthrobacter deserti]|nr:hypothetical protein [Arthrobacter deserti]
GDILPSSSAAVNAVSRGNPMFVLALLAQARRDGSLTERNGVWMLTRQHLSADLRLRDLVRGHLGRHAESSRDVLETVALAVPLPLAVLLQTVSGEQVDSLVQDGIITVNEGSDRLVRIAHPLFGEVIRSAVPTGRSLQIRQRIIPLLETRAPAGDRFLRFVDWSLDCGQPVPAGRLLAAAALANSCLDSRRALRAAQAVTDPAYSEAARIEVARAHVQLDDYDRARQVLDGLMEQATDLGTLRAAALLEARVCAAGTDASPLAELAGRWSAAIDRVLAADTAGRLRVAGRAARTGVRLLELYALVLEGRYGGTEAELNRILAESGAHPAIGPAGRALLGDVLIATGRADAGLKLTGEAMCQLTD